MKNTIIVSLFTIMAVVSVTVTVGFVAKLMWEPSGIFISCVAVDPVSFVGLVLGVVALTLAVWNWLVRK